MLVYPHYDIYVCVCACLFFTIFIYTKRNSVHEEKRWENFSGALCKHVSFEHNGTAELRTYMYTVYSYFYIYIYTSSAAQGGGGSFKNTKPIGRVGCCDSRMAERIH